MSWRIIQILDWSLLPLISLFLLMEALRYLEALSVQHQGTLVEGVALEFTIPILVYYGEYQTAISRLEALRSYFPGTDMAKHLLFQEGMIYKHEVGNAKKAEEIFQTFIKEYPEDELVHMAEMELNTMNLPKPRAKGFTEASNPTFCLSQNQPNPFPGRTGNPTTQISFTLPNSSLVTLEIYNILGQRVRTLVEGMKEAGSHSVLWDSRDQFGKVVPSGIYLYRLKADLAGQADFVRVKKMLLVR